MKNNYIFICIKAKQLILKVINFLNFINHAYYFINKIISIFLTISTNKIVELYKLLIFDFPLLTFLFTSDF